MKKTIRELVRDYPAAFILLLGLVMRSLFLIFYYSSPDWSQLLVDSLFHQRWAEAIAAGDVWGKDPFFRAPFYIYLLGLLYSIFGHSILVARIFGALCGLTAVYFTYGIALKVFSKRTAVAAGILHAMYPIAIYFESEILVEGLFTVFLEASIFVFLISLERKNGRFYFLSGLLLGFAAITRPLALALAPVFLIYAIWRGAIIRKGTSGAILFFVALFLPIIPVTLRNVIVGDDLVLISSSGGINFYIGNNATADGYSASMPPLMETTGA